MVRSRRCASQVAAALLCLIAFALVSLARYQFGRAFSVSAQARYLVTAGLYARFRNPIYVFAEFFLAGLALLSAVLVAFYCDAGRDPATSCAGAEGSRRSR